MFKVGQRLTWFFVGGMAFTGKYEITITRKLGDRFVYKKRGKRKEFYLSLEKNQLLFEGWDLPIRTDSDPNPNLTEKPMFSTYRGNACLNLCADSIDIIKDYVENKNLIEGFVGHDHILYIDGETETLVYPESPTTSALIESMRRKQGAA